MAYTFEQIREAVLLMQAQQGPLITKMRDILLRYEGDYIIPLPDVEKEPKMPHLTPALVGEAIDQIALRAASVHPLTICPPLDPTKTQGVRSREFASTRARIIEATYEDSRWKLARRRVYRQLTAYHTASIVVIPDVKRQMPRIESRDPLSTFIEPMANESLRDPNYFGTIVRYSGDFLRKRWPQCAHENGGPITRLAVDKLWNVIEWYDCEHYVLGLIGPVDTYGVHVADFAALQPAQAARELVRLPNRAECVPVCVPRNVSLGGIASRIGALLGSVDLQAKLMALHIIAQEKAIFPDVYVLGRGQAEPSLVDGTWKDGRTGDINRLSDVEAVGVLRTSPDPTTGQMIDRLERNFRTSTSLVPQLGGETYGAMRTGRAIDALSGIALDPRVQEAHEITESYLPTLNKAILATFKGYWPNKQYSLYTGKASDRKLVEFIPAKHIESTENTVSYFIAGADLMQLTQVLGSLFGANAISQRTFREQHPLIGNADVEAAQRREEDLENAAMQSLQQQLMAGQLPPTVAGMIHKHVAQGDSIFEAIEKADKELRALQATPAEQPPPESGMTMPPEAMPGLTGGPAADQQPQMQPQVQVPGDAARMRQLMQTMGA